MCKLQSHINYNKNMIIQLNNDKAKNCHVCVRIHFINIINFIDIFIE